jgi:dTMP kinase
MTGLFLAFEGIDGCGKTTQLARLAALLREEEHHVVTTREPGGTEIGERIRGLLFDEAALSYRPETAAMLMCAARVEHVERVIRPAIERGAVVLSDRYAASTLAYQGGGQGVDEAWLSSLLALATRGCEPTRYLLFDLPVEVARRRRGVREGGNHLDRQGLAFDERVRRAYLDLAAGDPERWIVVDGAGAEEEVFASLVVALEAVLPRQPVGSRR